jgi:hypothetical protein
MAVIGRYGRDRRIRVLVSAAHARIAIFGIRCVHAGACKGALESQSMTQVSRAMEIQVIHVSE